jgi:hypothetical protein
MSDEKTSVEWLFTMLNNPNRDQEFANKLLQKAKEMHKKEIKDAIFWGNIKGYDEHKRTWVFDEDEQYYNETYGGGNK